MAAWVSATMQNGQKVFLNLDAAASVAPLPDRLTRIAFPGRQDDYFDVKEAASDLFSRAGFAVPSGPI